MAYELSFRISQPSPERGDGKYLRLFEMPIHLDTMEHSLSLK